MGRPRREPKDEKEKRELERLRENQKNCRQRKLDKVDEYKKKIDGLNSEVHMKMVDFTSQMKEFDHLKGILLEQGLHRNDEYHLSILEERMKTLSEKVEGIRNCIKELDRPSSI